MAACPLVDLLAGARLVVGIKGEVAGIGPGQLEQQGSMGARVCCCLHSFFGNIKGKLDLLWVFAERRPVLCTETSHVLGH